MNLHSLHRWLDKLPVPCSKEKKITQMAELSFISSDNVLLTHLQRRVHKADANYKTKQEKKGTLFFQPWETVTT